MSLSNFQYDAIMREYEAKRIEAQHMLNEHKEEVYDIIPHYKELDVKISDLAMESARKVLSGEKEALIQMKEEIEKITEQQNKLLGEFAFPDDYLMMHYECEDCKDTGYAGNKKCHCLVQKINKVLYKQSNIEEILKKENFDTLTYDYYLENEIEGMRRIIDECKRFASDFEQEYKNLLLYGDVGVGKTFLTNCIAKELLDKGHSVIYFTSIQLFDTLSQYAFRRDESPTEINDVHRDIFECELLIIDDLGTETLSSFVTSQLFLILNERDVRNKSTIISTNLSLSLLAERYSERNFSRIFGSFKALKPDIQDIRIKKKRQGNV